MPSKTVIEQRDPDFDLINDIEEEFNHHMKKNESRAFATKQQVDTLPRNDGVPDSIPKQHMQSIPTISQANISFAQTRNQANDKEMNDLIKGGSLKPSFSSMIGS